MDKMEFLSRLETELSGLPREDAAERLAFYVEMIDDRVEDGLPEESAVAELGSVEDLAARIRADIPLSRLVRERVRSWRKRSVGEIVLLVLGAPLWIPLLIAVFAVLLSVYIAVWAVIVSVWAAELSIAVSAPAALVMGVWLLLRGDGQTGMVLISAGLVLAGLSIFLFFAFLAVTRGTLVFTKKIAQGIRSLFLRKEKET